MTRKPITGRIFALMVLLALPVCPVQAAEVFRVASTNASASFSSTDLTGCIDTSISVDVFDSLTREPAGSVGPSRFAFISISRFDTCQEVFLDSRFGVSRVFSFSADRDLSTAAFAATFDVQDQAGLSSTVSVNLSWLAVDALHRETSHSTTKAPGFEFVVHITGMGRTAEAFGTVLDAGTNLIPGASEFATLASANTGSVYVNSAPRGH